jgi:hypothetical protein
MGSQRRFRRHHVARGAAVSVTCSALALVFTASGGAGAAQLGAATGPGTVTPLHPSLAPDTLNNQADPTFNQLLGINNAGVIAGYFGIGSAGHPNKGYTLAPPYGQGNYLNENYPGSVQTQVTAINNDGVTAGFWANHAGGNFGFLESNGVFTSVTDPAAPKGPKAMSQVLGVNDDGDAVGFYNDAQNNSHAFERLATGKYVAINVPGASSVTATGINDKGDITGFFTPNGASAASSFIDTHGVITVLNFPGGTNTQALGINNADELVGSFAQGGGTHGFLVTRPVNGALWHRYDDPNGVGHTVLNGLNDAGQVVGFYADAAGNTDGLLANPAPYSIVTHHDNADPTFNQLLGINDAGVAAGYFGSGVLGHPNKGYIVRPPYGQKHYVNENFPGSAQTQVTGISNTGETVGFWVDGAGNQFGFVDHQGSFTTVRDPHTGTGRVNQLLGINSSGIAVGFYTDGAANNHAYLYNTANGTFRAIKIPGSPSVTATGISDDGAVVGFFTTAKGAVTESFELYKGQLSEFSFPGSTNTQALGVNVNHEVVGSYVDDADNTHGFTVTDVGGHPHFAVVSAPAATTTMVVNGLNDQGRIVGFFQDAAGNFDGFIGN